MKRRLRDLVVVLPGITGSVLRRAGRDIWAPSHRLAARVAARPGGAAEDLTLRPDDGVTAVALVPDAHMVGGLVKIDGYTQVVRAIDSNFLVVREPRTANLVEFPYHWRLDNRVNARRLRDVVEPALHRWRRHTGTPDARTILVAHSMGGLVARYYLEVLGGWRDCRALVTFGTPFRGSLDALGYLANGYKKLHVDLSAAMRSFPSVHQLLPIYPALLTPAGYRRVAETKDLVDVDSERAADALRFHREIEAAVADNDAVDPYRYALLPVVGTHQPTHQSAVVDHGRVTLGPRLPDGVDPFFADDGVDGDGTVPVSSAIPLDLSNVGGEVYLSGKHGALQNSPHVLGDLVGKLARMQAGQLRKLRGPDPSGAFGQPALAVAVDDAFHPDEPVEVRARGLAGAGPLREVRGDVESLATGEVRRVALARSGDGWGTVLHPLPPGTYRLTVVPSGTGAVPLPVSDLFEVAVPG